MDVESGWETIENVQDYQNLLKIPKVIIFPLELSIHLKERLQVALEEIFRLKKQLCNNQDYELTCAHLKAEKSKSDKYFETQEYKLTNMATSQMATKVVELCKKNRDMMAEMESMKTKMKQLMSENEFLKLDLATKTESPPIKITAIKSEEEIMSTAQQLANCTTKMMDYRRQSQQTRLELRMALKALSQEVGDGTTPQMVLTTVSNSGWRGRQQQIIGLQQKIHELQHKLSTVQQGQNHDLSLLSDGGGGGEPCNTSTIIDLQSCSQSGVTSDLYDDKSIRSVNSNTNSVVSLPISAAQRRLLGLHQQERNKFEQLEKTSQQLEEIKKELKNSQQNLKGSKARVQTLEYQVKTCKNQIQTLEGKLGAKEMELQEHLQDMKNLQIEFGTFKERMRTMRDKASLEVLETNQSLIKEKTQTSKLQKIIQLYEEKVSTLTSQLRELESNFAAYEKSPLNDVEARKRLQFLEHEFEEIKGGMRASENESRRLLALVEESVRRIEEERWTHGQTQRQLVKSFTVIDYGDQCLHICLEAGHIVDKKVLETVEDFRSMMRELKIGEVDPIALSDVKKLRSKIRNLNKEIGILEKQLRQSGLERRIDLQNFAQISERTRQDFLLALSNSVKMKQGQVIENLKREINSAEREN